MARYADGIIVGSAIMKLITKHGRDAEPYVAEYVREMKEAVRGQGRGKKQTVREHRFFPLIHETISETLSA